MLCRGQLLARGVSLDEVDKSRLFIDLYSIIDIAYNPDVLQRGQENPEKMEHLIHLTLKFVEERCNLTLSHLYTIESFKLKGSLEMMQQRLRGRQRPSPHLGQNTKKGM